MNFRILFLSILMLGCFGLDMRYMCEHSADADVADKCFSTLALNDDNTTTCMQVQNASMREYCVMRIAISTLNESDCKDMQTLRDQCVHVVMGLRVNDSLVCMLVQDSDTADLCRMRVM
jgi:hypothetical protein